MVTVMEDEDILDVQPFRSIRSSEKSTVDSRKSANGEPMLTPVSALSTNNLVHSAPLLKDSAWATTFKVNIGVAFLLALYYGGPVLRKLATLECSEQRLCLQYEEWKNHFFCEFRLETLFIVVTVLGVMVTIVKTRLRTLLRMINRYLKFIIKVWRCPCDCLHTRKNVQRRALRLCCFLFF